MNSSSSRWIRTHFIVEFYSFLYLDIQGEKMYYIMVEGININNGTKSFHEALKQTFAVYYIFNMAYPKEVSASLEFIQKYFLKFND